MHPRKPYVFRRTKMYVVKGMVQVSGTTYRVVQRDVESYEVIRIHDEVVAGIFSCGATRTSKGFSVDALLMKRIAAAAVQQGRTSWTPPPARAQSADSAVC